MVSPTDEYHGLDKNACSYSMKEVGLSASHNVSKDTLIVESNLKRDIERGTVVHLPSIVTVISELDVCSVQQLELESGRCSRRYLL